MSCFMQGEGSPVHRAWVCQVVAGCVTDLMMQGNSGRLVSLKSPVGLSVFVSLFFFTFLEVWSPIY